MMEDLLKLLALLLALFFTLRFFLGLFIKRRAFSMQGREAGILKGDGVVYFYSERCGACKMMKPEIDRLKKVVKVLEINVATPDGYQRAKELGVLATPTTLVVKDGIIKKAFVGYVKAERILKEV